MEHGAWQKKKVKHKKDARAGAVQLFDGDGSENMGARV